MHLVGLHHITMITGDAQRTVDFYVDRLAEGIATITADALAKDAPHPNAAKLFYRWSASEEGQKAYAAGGRLPIPRQVEPKDSIAAEVSPSRSSSKAEVI